jgi:hypothetical protein
LPTNTARRSSCGCRRVWSTPTVTAVAAADDDDQTESGDVGCACGLDGWVDRVRPGGAPSTLSVPARMSLPRTLCFGRSPCSLRPCRFSAGLEIVSAARQCGPRGIGRPAVPCRIRPIRRWCTPATLSDRLPRDEPPPVDAAPCRATEGQHVGQSVVVHVSGTRACRPAPGNRENCGDAASHVGVIHAAIFLSTGRRVGPASSCPS